MSDHAWVHQNLDAYAMGGMTADERETVAQHLAGCPECARALAEVRHVEKLLDNVLADARPDAGLEDRVIQRLRRAVRSRPGILRFVAAAAAVLVLGVLGCVLQALVADAGKDKRGMIAQIRLAAPGFGWDDAMKEGQVKVQKQGLDVQGKVEQGYFPEITIDQIKVERTNDMSIEVGDKEKAKLIARDELQKSVEPLKTFNEDARKHYYSLNLKELVTREKTVSTLKMQQQAYYDQGKLKEYADAQREIVKALDKLKGDYKDEESGMSKAQQSQSKPDQSKPGNDQSTGKPGGSDKGGDGKPSEGSKIGSGKATEDGYYGPSGDKSTIKSPEYFAVPGKKDPGGNPKPGPAPGTSPPPPVLPVNPPAVREGDKPKPDDQPPPVKKPALQPEPEPEPAQRKIIRSGEMEFEVDSFYASVSTIDGILKAKTKGKGVVATVNSDQLPNGKIRGSIVVRMPPEYLDAFLKELREALAKTGELKSERIGSQDVTKAYTDLDSELTAAKAVAKRFISIIESGKGEIKDLIAAEKELGVWRTKIEKLEGEIRYYNNLIAMSTITIHLTEKQIQAATALVMRERVQMNIEVEDVDEGTKAVRAGVKAAKGRILKAEMKRADAGQMIADIHVDIPPGSAELFRELLRKLGTVTRHQSERTQHAEGGTAGQRDIKEREDDVRFELNLYNTANIKPRETFNLKIASPDVVAAYRKLKDTIEKAKGQVRRANLDEQDKLDIHADLEFNVAVADRPVIDKLIAEQGFIIKRHTVQAAVNEMSTDRKVGYEIKLRSVAAISPKEIFRYGVTVQDVQESYRVLFDAVVNLKGRIHKGNVDEQDKYNIRAELNFDIATAEKPAFDKLLKAAGVVALSSSEQAAPNIDSTELKVGYRIAIRSILSVPPREVITIALATQDVALSQLQLHEEAIKLKARVHRTHLMEHDQFNVTAVFDFDVAAQDRPNVDKLLAKLGAVITRSNTQAGLKDDATDLKVGYRLSLRNVTSIKPRDTYTIHIAAQDVAAAHMTLREEILRLKGHVLHTQLQELDRFQVTADFHFDVNAQDRPAVEKILKGLGVTQARTNAQAGLKEEATDLKVGYRLTIRNVAGLAPRDNFKVQVAAQDVAASHRKLVDEVTRLKGHILKTQLNEEDRVKVSAELKFDVNAADRPAVDKLISEAGVTISRRNEPDPKVADPSDLRVGYELTLRSATSIPPRDTYSVTIAAPEVVASHRKLLDEVTRLKGRVSHNKLNEEDRVKVSAELDFEINAGDRAAIDAVLRDAGATISRKNVQADTKDEATDLKIGYRIKLNNVAGAEPRETTALQVQVDDVDRRVIELKAIAQNAKGRVTHSSFNRHENGKVDAKVIFDVPLSTQDSVVHQIQKFGYVEKQNASPNKDVSENEFSTARIVVILTTASPIVPSDEGLGEQMRHGLYWAFRLFSWCLVAIITGLAIIVPAAFVIWFSYKVVSWLWPTPSAMKAVSLTPTSGATALKPDEPKPSA